MFGRSLVLCAALLPGGLGEGPKPVEPDPIFNTIDLNATYTAVKRIFSRMKLTPKEMAVLIGGGHSSGQSSLEGGTYHGNWVEPMTLMGNAYFQLLSGHHNWCAVASSDNGNAHFVAKGVQPYIAETEYSPLAKHLGQIPCVETEANKAVYDNLPSVPAEELIYQPGIWHKPSGAASFLPVDFALQYANETYEHVVMWAGDANLFFKDFQDAWAKLTENGQRIRCPDVNSPADFDYSAACADRFGADEASYRAMWINIRSDIKSLFDALPSRCNSIRPAARRVGDSEGSVCPSSVFRLGFHVSATYDPEAEGNVGGSSFTSFLGPCAVYDGCAGCLQDTVLSLQCIQKRYQHLKVSLADVTVYAAGLAAAYLAELKLNHMPFHPGREDPGIPDYASCKELGDRMPSPAYQWRSPGDAAALAGMLDGDLLMPSVPGALESPDSGVVLV
mmetsp:Transcript_96163/g.311856  ORF Transcript_96163/g.311856 Transcript_96163/m.311856 type:complete len:447 (-) Transcript_96163:259-1599(-)